MADTNPATSVLKMDASDMERGLTGVTKAQQLFNKEAEATAAIFEKLGFDLNRTNVVITKVAENGVKMSAVLGKVEDQVKVLSSTTKITNEQLLRFQKLFGEAPVPGRTNWQNSAKVVKELTAAMYQNQTQQERMARRLEDQQRKAAGFTRTQLLLGTPSVPGATGKEVAAVNEQINKIKNAVGEGAISMQRALQIVDEQIKGVAGSYTNSEQQIAAAAQRMIKAQQNLGNEAAKAAKKAADEARALAIAQTKAAFEIQQAADKAAAAALKQSQAAATASSNQAAGGILGSELRTTFLRGRGDASAAEVAKVTAEINKIQQIVASGGVTLARANEIIHNSIIGVAVDYNATEQKVANATQRMIKNANGLGVETAKAAEAVRIATRDAAEAQLEADRKIRQSTQEGLRIQREARAERLRAAAGQGAATTLKREFITPGFSTEQEVGRVAAAISKVQALVQSGEVSAKVALNIVRSVAAGTADTYTGTAAKVATAAGQIVAANKGLGKEFDKIQADIERARKSTEKATQSIGLSWRAMARLFLIQTIHTVVTNLSNALRSAVTEAAAFQVAISEIRTISLENQLSFNGWSAAVRGLSDQFGKPIDDVAKGTYELISNQVAAGTDAVLLMQKAMVFAQTAVTSTANAVNILSSALKSYNLDQSQADIVLAQFFKTIELGRVRADDLANTIGRVAPLANSLGVDLANLNAAIATISVQGVTPSESLTAIQGVLTKLLRPTKEMSAIFKEWGVNNANAAIATFTFAGVLEKLAKAAAEGKIEIGEVFNEIRATRGFLGLTNVFSEFTKNLNEIKSSAFGDYMKAQIITTESAGKTFQVEMNKVKNFFIEDFGASVLNAVVYIAKLGGETNSLTSYFGGLKVALNTLLLGFVAFKVVGFLAPMFTNIGLKARLAAFHMSTMGFAMERVKLSAGGVATALTAGIFVYQLYSQKVDEAARFHAEAESEIAIAVDKSTKAQSISLSLRTQAVEEAVKKQFQVYFANAAEVNKLYNQIAENQKRTTKLTTESMRNSFDILTGDIQKKISGFQSQIEQANSNIKKAGEQLADSMEGLHRGRFERQVKLAPDDEQAQLLLARAAQLNASANTSLAVKTSDAAKAEENLAQSTRERQEADRLNNELLDRRINSEKKAADLEEKIAELQNKANFNEATNAEADRIRELQNELADTARKPRGARGRSRKEIQDQLREARGERGDEADDESARRIAARLADLKGELATHQKILGILPDRAGFEKLFTDSTKEQQKALREYIGLQQKIRDQAEDAARQEKVRFEFLKDSFKALNAIKIDSKVDTVEEKVKVLNEFDARLAEAQEKGGLTDQSVLRSITEQRVELEKQADIQIEQHRQELRTQGLEIERKNLIEQQAKIAAGEDEINKKAARGRETALKDAEEALKAFTSRGNIFSLKDFGDEEATANLGKKIDDLVNNASKQSNAETLSQAIKIQAEFSEAVDRYVKFAGGLSGFAGSDDKFIINKGTAGQDQRTLADVRQEFNDAIRLIVTSARERETLEGAKGAFNARLAKGDIKVEELKPLDKTTADVDKFGRAFVEKIGASTDSVVKLNREIDETAKRLRDMVPSPPGGIPQPRAHGGPIYWRSRGLDTVPAMLRPGEFIVNPDATRKHYNDLLAINSGRTPQYFAHGGLVMPSPVVQTISRIQAVENSGGNVQVGDIHVTQTSTGNARVDAQELGEELRRRILSGRLTLPQNRRKS